MFNTKNKFTVRTKNNINRKDAFKVASQTIPNQTVKINNGILFDYDNRLYIEYNGVFSTRIISPPPINTYKWVVIAVSNNNLHILEGAPSTNKSPILPTIDSTYLVLSLIYYRYTDTKIIQDMIYDVREFLDFDTSNQTIPPPVVLHKLNPKIIVDRGLNRPKPIISFNELEDRWEFTNDGFTYIPLNGGSGGVTDVTWGDITGDIINQTDLESRFANIETDYITSSSLAASLSSYDDRLLVLEGSEFSSISDITFNNLTGDVTDNTTLVNYLTANYVSPDSLSSYVTTSDFTDNINEINNQLSEINDGLSGLTNHIVATPNQLNITVNDIRLSNLPTSNPVTPGRLYNLLGVVMVSV